MLVAQYNQQDVHNETLDYFDTSYWEDFALEVYSYLKDRKFPLQLIAINSNWKGQTGYTEAESADDIIRKISSFGSSYYELHKIGNSYEFRLSTHDVPTGFTIQTRSL